jgi:hypothetical protein
VASRGRVVGKARPGSKAKAVSKARGDSKGIDRGSSRAVRGGRIRETARRMDAAGTASPSGPRSRAVAEAIAVPAVAR